MGIVRVAMGQECCGRILESMLSQSNRNGLKHHGISWNIMECNGISWNIMECYGIAWNIMENHGTSMIIILGKHPWRLQDTDLGKETIQRL